jgi:hypothetical protein
MRCPKANQVRLVSAVDGVDSVIYRSVHDGKAAAGVSGCGLCARGADNNQECLIPLHYLAHRLRRLGLAGATLAAASAATVAPAKNRVFIFDLTRVDMSGSPSQSTRL